MIELTNTDVYGWEAAIRGMRNPMNSWDRSDSYKTVIENPETLNTADFQFFVGDDDKDLMMKLASGGSVHAKYRRMITVTVDITAPLYWWKEFDTYKVGTVANSCSTMHKIHSKAFTLDDFSHEHLMGIQDFVHFDNFTLDTLSPIGILARTIDMLNECRNNYLETKDKRWWWQMIQLLPNSYNQKRTVMLNYEVLVGIYRDRRNHKLTEWVDFCKWIDTLPHAEVIACG